MSKPHPIIQTVLDAHFPGMAKPVTMESECEIDRLRVENAALRERADVRAIVGELRGVLELLNADYSRSAEDKLSDLLRRLEEP